jgi:hypothetical protein
MVVHCKRNGKVIMSSFDLASTSLVFNTPYTERLRVTSNFHMQWGLPTVPSLIAFYIFEEVDRTKGFKGLLRAE